MALNIVELPYSYFPDFNRGRPLFNADIYVGNVDTDPEIPANQKQVTVRQEDGTEVQIAQPVKASAGGVPTYNGSPVTVLVEGAYSIKVLDRFGAEEYYSPDVTKGVPITLESLPAYTDLVFDSVADMIAGAGIITWSSETIGTKITVGGKLWVQSSFSSPMTIANFTAANEFDTLAEALASPYVALTNAITVRERTSGDGGGATWYVVEGETENGANIINHDTLPFQLKLDIGRTVSALQIGIKPNDEAAAASNSAIYTTIKDILSPSGGALRFALNDYYFSESLLADDSFALVGDDGVTYREDHEGQVKLITTTDVDGISYGGANSYRNTIKNIKIESGLALGASTKTGINFSSNGGSQGTRGLANILDNVTVENYQVGIDSASPGDFTWFRQWSNIKIFRCETALVIDGSDGAGSIDGIHIDAAGGGFAGTTIGFRVDNSNGLVIRNYSIENCNRGIVWNGDDNNDRIYLYGGYFENNSTADLVFNTNSLGQIYSYASRMAWFSAAAKNQCILANFGSAVQCEFYDLTVRGETDGSDGLIRLMDASSNSTRINFTGLNIQTGITSLWRDFGGGVAPVYIRMLNQDKNGNWVELSRDTLNTSRMFASTQRVSGVAPTNDTFAFDVPGGATLDLKYTGANVRGLTAGAWNEWIWDGAAFVATP